MFGSYVPLSDFLRSPESALFCYPDTLLSDDRILEIKNLGVTGVYRFGAKRVGNWQCLGIGYCGAVLLVQTQKQVAALKVRRTDAPQESFEREAKGLAIANKSQVGPQLIAHTQNFLLMGYAAGQPLGEWLSKSQSRDTALQVIRDLLHQAFRLDQAGIDHGNLRCVTSHVVVNDNQPTLLDFSSVSCDRRPANVTTLTQGLFWGTVIAQKMKDIGISPNKENCIQQLRAYKQLPNFNNFNSLLSLLESP